MTTGKFIWRNFFSIFFSFGHNVLTLSSTITSMSSFSNVFQILIILFMQKKKTNFSYLHKVVNDLCTQKNNSLLFTESVY